MLKQYSLDDQKAVNESRNLISQLIPLESRRRSELKDENISACRAYLD